MKHIKNIGLTLLLIILTLKGPFLLKGFLGFAAIGTFCVTFVEIFKDLTKNIK